jgi:regulator of protease activity HflC (stomatin/prohibitin superfamily)
MKFQTPPKMEILNVDWDGYGQWLIRLLVLFFLGGFLLKFFVYVQPNEYGIKQINIGLKKGIQPEVYDAGLHFVIPFGFEVMHRFPRNIQVFELTNYPSTVARGVRVEKAAHIQTSDGFFVDVDVSILYHIVDPYKVITTIGPGTLYEDNAVVARAEAKLKEALGEMTTEEFYNSPLRVAQSEKARVLLNDELLSRGIEVQAVLVRYFLYNDEIQRNIEEKKLKDQLVFTNQSKARASMEEALVKKVREEGEAKVRVKLEEGRAYVVKKIAEKDLYVRSKNAEADLLIKLADATKTELINNAYQNEGSDKLIGLRMAEVYQGLNLIVLSSAGEGGVNPLDLENSLKLFGVEQSGEK